jgi:hypothetical protein
MVPLLPVLVPDGLRPPPQARRTGSCGGIVKRYRYRFLPPERRYACAVARAKHPAGTEPFDVTLPAGFELGDHLASFEEAAKQSGWTIERDGAAIVVRDVWTENEDHAAWLVATKAGLALERVTVWAGRESSSG